MDENSFLNVILPKLKQQKDIIVGPGDDCAVIDIGDQNRYLLMAVDQIISNIHFDPEITEPEDVGAKLIKRNISDIASMGGMPAHAVVTIAAADFDVKWLEKFYNGLEEEAEKWNVSVCGGDLASLPQPTTNKQQLITTLTITGYVNRNKLCLRENAKPGDAVFATGYFGNSYFSKHHLTFIPRVEEANFVAGEFTSTAMDVSDGLLIDLQRLAKASNVTLLLNTDNILFREGAQNIKSALTDGEDYELIFCIPDNKKEILLKKWPFDAPLTQIGEVVDKISNLDVGRVKNTVGVEEYENLIYIYSNKGWDHLDKS